MSLARTLAAVVAATSVAAVGVAVADTVSSTAKGGAPAATAGQVKTTQRISSAAVARSNRALNYLAPIRTDATDGADDGTKGIIALSAVVGSGKGWTGAQIADGAISNAKLADNAVAGSKLADNGVAGTKLADAAVATAKVLDGAITTPKLANGAVTSAKIGNGQVTAAQVGTGAITGPKIANGSVTVDKLGADVTTMLPDWATKDDNAASITTGANGNVQSSDDGAVFTRTAVGVYTVKLSQGAATCSVIASPFAGAGATPAAVMATASLGTDELTITVRTLAAGGSPVDSGFSVSASC